MSDCVNERADGNVDLHTEFSIFFSMNVTRRSTVQLAAPALTSLKVNKLEINENIFRFISLYCFIVLLVIVIIVKNCIVLY